MICIGKTQTGQPCRGHALTGSEYCFFHDPSLEKPRLAAQSKGGSNRSRVVVMPTPHGDFDLEDPRQIAKLLTYTVHALVGGQIDTKVAYTLGYLGDCAVRAHNAVALVGRLAAMERMEHVEHSAPGRPVAVIDSARKTTSDLSDRESQQASLDPTTELPSSKTSLAS
jgi:hypothetical protein